MMMVDLEVVTTVLHYQSIALKWQQLVQINAPQFVVPSAHQSSITASATVASAPCTRFLYCSYSFITECEVINTHC
jgi:hypothetical protein